MATRLDRPDTRALAWNLFGVIVAVLAVNGLIFGLGWTGAAAPDSKTAFDPPGWLVGSVWVVLFALMGVARWLLTPHPRVQLWVTALLISCLLWPLYALTTRSLYPGLLGNVETILLSGFVVRRAWPLSRPAALLTLPVILWVLFATATIFVDLGWL